MILQVTGNWTWPDRCSNSPSAVQPWPHRLFTSAGNTHCHANSLEHATPQHHPALARSVPGQGCAGRTYRKPWKFHQDGCRPYCRTQGCGLGGEHHRCSICQNSGMLLVLLELKMFIWRSENWWCSISILEVFITHRTISNAHRLLYKSFSIIA